MKYFVIIISVLLFCCCKTKHASTYADPPVIDNGLFDPEDARLGARVRGSEDSIAKVMQWKQLKDGFLWVNKNGDIGYMTSYLVTNFSSANKYITQFYGGDVPLKTVIDTASFRRLTPKDILEMGAYFKDSNNVYHLRDDSNGDVFSIVEGADQATFEILSKCYARDKRYVYDMENGRMDSINPKKFKVLRYKETCFAKYNNTYYFKGNVMPKTMMDGPEVKQIMQQLDKL